MVPAWEAKVMTRWKATVGGSMLGAVLLLFNGGCDEEAAAIVWASLDLAAAIIGAAT